MILRCCHASGSLTAALSSFSSSPSLSPVSKLVCQSFRGRATWLHHTQKRRTARVGSELLHRLILVPQTAIQSRTYYRNLYTVVSTIIPSSVLTLSNHSANNHILLSAFQHLVLSSIQQFRISTLSPLIYPPIGPSHSTQASSSTSSLVI